MMDVKFYGFVSVLVRVTRIEREEVGWDACQQAGLTIREVTFHRMGNLAGATNETNPTPTNEARVVLTPVDRSDHFIYEPCWHIRIPSLPRYHSHSGRHIFNFHNNGHNHTAKIAHQLKRTTYHPPRNQTPKHPHSPLERPPNLATRQHPHPLRVPPRVKLLQQILFQPHTPAQRDRKHLHSPHRCLASTVRCCICLW
jgi:hypothetical protein